MNIVTGFLAEDASFTIKMELLKANHQNDPKTFHVEADNLMCDLLEKLGFFLGVKTFREAKKWHA